MNATKKCNNVSSYANCLIRDEMKFRGSSVANITATPDTNGMLDERGAEL